MKTLLPLIALVPTIFAAPAKSRGKHAFEIKQVNVGQVRRTPGPVAMLKTYEKYAAAGAVAPAIVIKAATAATVQAGSVVASPEAYDSSYLCPVSVGGQTLNMNFDTGSADLWVHSTLSPQSASSGHATYNPQISGTLKSGYTWKISYGDGSGASGVVYADKVVVSGVTATPQAVEAATSVSAQFIQDTDNDGLLGLAFSTLNQVSPVRQNTFFDTVKSSLATRLFTADLRKGAAGAYGFGYIDTSRYVGSIAYVPVNTANGFWQFTAGAWTTGSSNLYSGSVGDAIADTGTSLLYLPASIVTAYYKQVPSATYNSAWAGYVFSCSAQLPAFKVIIGNQVFTVPGSYVNYGPISSTQCFGGIQSNTGIGFSIFGDIFLKAVFAVFDQTQSAPRIGFASQS